MSVVPILRWPDARLSEVCAEVAHGEDVAGLLRDMFDTMYAAQGRGLAAPQIGVMRRVFVMDAGWKEGAPRPMACVNPKLTDRSDCGIVMEEGCLSIPGVTAKVRRPEAVTLRYGVDADAPLQDAPLTGAEARIAQHEIDHLDGLVHFDRLDATERAALMRRFEALT